MYQVHTSDTWNSRYVMCPLRLNEGDKRQIRQVCIRSEEETAKWVQLKLLGSPGKEKGRVSERVTKAVALEDEHQRLNTGG